jgi:putative membrane protein
MSEGFLGFRASLMLDVVVCALVLVVPILVFSICQVKYRRNYALHKQLQLFLAVALTIAVAAFEVDMQLVHGGWENVVNKNPESPRRSGEEIASIRNMLYVHLFFAVTTPVLWAVTIYLALKRFPRPAAPSPHSPLHKKLGWLSTIDLVLTSITGLMFYYMAFVAE